MIDTKALRNKILDLAISGKLTEQLPEDRNAEDWALINKDEQNMTDIDNLPFEIPTNWTWCRLSSICETNIGLTYHPQDVSENGTVVIRSSNIINNKMDYSDIVRVNCDIKDKQYLKNHDIVICVRNGSKALIGKCALYEEKEKSAFGAFMSILRTPFYGYVFCYLQTFAFRRYFSNDDTKQINQITQSILKNALIPLPPLPEQKRIVSVVENVFAIIDRIEKAQESYYVDQEVLKNKIIDAGIRGKLTEQLPEDGNAEDLYAQIQEEKARLIAEGKIKKEKPLPPIAEEEVPFEIPKNWKWVRIGELSWNHGQTIPKETFSYIDVGTLDNINHRLSNSENIIEAKNAPSRARKKVEYGDVLYSTVRPYLHNICVINKEFSKEPIASTAFCVMCVSNSLMVNYYLFYCLLSSYFDKYANGDPSKGTLYPAIGEKDFLNGLIPLPPLAEQKRIVDIIKSIQTCIIKNE